MQARIATRTRGASNRGHIYEGRAAGSAERASELQSCRVMASGPGGGQTHGPGGRELSRDGF